MKTIRKILILFILMLIIIGAKSVNAAEKTISIWTSYDSSDGTFGHAQQHRRDGADGSWMFCGEHQAPIWTGTQTYIIESTETIKVNKSNNSTIGYIPYMFSFFRGASETEQDLNILGNAKKGITTREYVNLQNSIWSKRDGKLNNGSVYNYQGKINNWVLVGNNYHNYITTTSDTFNYNDNTDYKNIEQNVNTEAGYIDIGPYNINYDYNYITGLNGEKVKLAGIESLTVTDRLTGQEIKNYQLITAEDYYQNERHNKGYIINSMQADYKFPLSGEKFYIRIPYSENIGDKIINHTDIIINIKFKKVTNIEAEFIRYNLQRINPFTGEPEHAQGMLEYEGSNITYADAELNLGITPDTEKWSFEVQKIDSETKNKMFDAYFKVKVEQSNNINEKWTIVKDEVEYQTREGKIIIDDLKCYGFVKFTITETKAPDGYKKLENPIEIIVYKEQGINGDITGYQIEDRNKNDKDNNVWHELNIGNPRQDTIVNNSSGAQKFTIIVANEQLKDFAIRLNKYGKNYSGNYYPLAKAEFSFDLQKINGTTIEKTIIKNYKATTNSDGIIYLSGTTETKGDNYAGKLNFENMDSGTYELVIREEKVPVGYKSEYYQIRIPFVLKNGVVTEIKYDEIKTKATERAKEQDYKGSEDIAHQLYNNRGINVFVDNTRRSSSTGGIVEGYDIVLNKVLLDNGRITSTLQNIEFDIELIDEAGNIQKWTKTTSKDGKITLSNITKTGNITLKITEKLTSEQQKLYGIEGDRTKIITYTAAIDYSQARLNRYYIVKDSWRINNNDSGVEIKDPIISGNEIEELTITIKNTGYTSLTMNLAGTVFVDGLTGKDGSTNNVYGAGDSILSNVEVILLDAETKNLVSTNARGEALKNPIRSDENGKYEFLDLNPMKKYIVKFTYNGQEYEDTEKFYNTDFDTAVKNDYSKEAWNGYSKALEEITDRKTVNSRFASIGDYPNSYLRADGSWNAAYSKDAIVQMYDLIAEQVEAGIIDNNTIRQNILAKKNLELTAEDVQMMLNYIDDCKVSAYTDAYPAFNKFTLSDDGEIVTINQSGDISWGENAISLYEGQNQINFGLSLRPDVDLRITDTVNKIDVHINGKQETYNYSELADVVAYLRTFDIKRNTAENEKGEAYYDNNDDLEVYVTHKIRITNESVTAATITDIIEYYDSRYYTFVSANKGTRDKIEEEIYGVTDITGTHKSGIYNAQKISINDADNEQYVYIKLKLNANAQTASQILASEGLTTEGASTSNMNYVEISGYSTGKDVGLVDRDSITGSFSPVAYEAEDKTQYNALTYLAEDDTSGAQTTFTALQSAYNSRALLGNVFEDTRINLSEEGKEISKDQVDTSSLPKIAGITVELVEILNDNTYVTRAKTTTNADGNYTFTNYIPGNYVVRFTYGDTEIIGNYGVPYNGQHYQSTYANPNTNETTYWYTDSSKYSDAYDKVQDRQTVIGYANEALVSGDENSDLSMNYWKTDILKNIDYSSTEGYMRKAIEANTIEAYTSKLELEVENATTSTIAKSDVTYNIPNVDFGLVKRAESKMTLEQHLSHLTITQTDGSILVDTPVTVETNLLGQPEIRLESGSDKVHFQYVGTPNSYGVGTAKLEIDDEILIGNIDLEYTITVRNDTPNATTLTYYKDAGDNIVAIGYYEEEKDKLVYWEDNGIRYYNDDTTEIKAGIKDGVSEVVTTKVKNIINYVSTNLNYDYSKNVEAWNLVTTPGTELVGINNGQAVNNEAYKEYNQILLAKIGSNKLLQDNLEPHYLNNNGERSETLILSATNTQDVDLNYYNITEILEVRNDAGRVDAYSTPGNLNPSIDYTNERKYSSGVLDNGITDKQAYEPDSSQAEHVLITDATGDTHYYYVLIGTVLVILTAGVVLIKKFVLDKNV